MIKIVEVKTKKQQKLFVKFQFDLYKDCKYFVPPFRKDEMDLFNPNKNPNYDDCEMVFYLAYKDDKVVGRIGGIIQGAFNKKSGKKYVRFTRIEFINDLAVVQALFKAVEDWAIAKGQEFVHGPLGFNDLEREGLLVEGFDRIATFEENYSFDYYPALIEKAGYQKDVDWVQYLVTVPNKTDAQVLRVARVSRVLTRRYNIKLLETKSTKEVINKHKDEIFKLLDICYSELYGTVPITEKQKAQLVSQFKMIVHNDFIAVITNDQDEIVGFGLALPNLAKAVQKTRGRYISIHSLKLLRAIRKPKTIDTALIAVRPDYRTRGVASLIINKIMSNTIARGIKRVEALPQLEQNIRIKNLFDDYEKEQHKRRRCYIKKL